MLKSEQVLYQRQALQVTISSKLFKTSASINLSRIEKKLKDIRERRNRTELQKEKDF